MKEHILFLVLSRHYSELHTVFGDRITITTIQATPDDIDNDIGERWFCGKRFSTIYCDAELYTLRKDFVECAKTYCTIGKKEFILI